MAICTEEFIKLLKDDDEKTLGPIYIRYHWDANINYSQVYDAIKDFNNPSINNILGYIYQYSLGVCKDFGKAFRYYSLAVDKGSNIAKMWRNHLLCSHDYIVYALLEQKKINEELIKQNEEFRKEIDELKIDIKYQPGGEEYREAKVEFESLKEF